MSIVYRIEVCKDMSVAMTNKLMNVMGVSKNTLHEDAIKNSQRIRKARTKTFSSYVEEILGESFPAPEAPDMWIITNMEGHRGASAVLYGGTLDAVAEQFGTGLIVFPSSIHEMIAVSDQFDIDGAEMLTKTINQTEVSEDDFLSDTVFHYDPDTKAFETLEEWKGRR